jgi:metacaspase-1
VPKIRAVLVGVDVYERSDIPPLQGCANDVALVRRMLKQFLGVPNEDIRVVVNERATRANIMHRLADMTQRAEPGDALVFYFSGHGSQIRDRDGDELTDWLDELICPYDMDWDRGTYILDDDLDALFADLPPDILFEAFFDCCFWGAGPRQFQPGPRLQRLRADVRYLAPPLDILARAEGDEDWLHHHQFLECQCFSDRNVLWAASGEGEPAAEDDFDGTAHGVFTYWGCRFIEESLARNRSYTRQELLEDLREYINSLGYVQMAELSAPDQLRVTEPFMPPADWETGLQARADWGVPNSDGD